MAIDWKEDKRPPKGGWAPGNYMNTCMHCQETFIGDKRAVSCADCAYKVDTLSELRLELDSLNLAVEENVYVRDQHGNVYEITSVDENEKDVYINTDSFYFKFERDEDV